MPQTCSKCISWTREATTQCMNFCRTYYIRFLLLFAIWMIYDCGNVTTTKNHIMLCCLGIRIKIKRLLPSTLCLSPERNLRSKSISIYSPHIIIPIYLATCVFLLLSASNRLITVSLRHLCRKSLQKENPDLLPFCLSVIFITHTEIRSNETTRHIRECSISDRICNQLVWISTWVLCNVSFMRRGRVQETSVVAYYAASSNECMMMCKVYRCVSVLDYTSSIYIRTNHICFLIAMGTLGQNDPQFLVLPFRCSIARTARRVLLVGVYQDDVVRACYVCVCVWGGYQKAICAATKSPNVRAE